MKKKNIILLVLFLLSLNIWKWWPGEGGGISSSNKKSEQLGYVDIKLPDTIYTIDMNGRAKRDIFNYKKSNMQPVVLNAQSENKSNSKRLNKSRITTKSYAKQNLKSEKLKLVGVLIKNNNRHAFIMSGEKKISLSVGDVFNGIYKINAIREVSVTLYNLKTNDLIELKL